MPVIIWDLDSTIFDTHFQLIHFDGTFDQVHDITPYPDAMTALGMHGVVHIMVSYAKHSVAIQNKKIDILGIRDFFDEVHIIPKHKDKFEAVKGIKDRFDGPFYVVGDKVDDEIEVGNRLGMTTVFCPRGEHMLRKPENEFEKPDYTIKNLTELRGIIESDG